MTATKAWAAQALDDERSARIVWAHLAEPRDTKAVTLIDQRGHCEALRAVLDSPDQYPAFDRRLHDLDLPEQRRREQRLGVRIIVPGDEEWPTRLDDLDEVPHCLFVTGEARLSEVVERSVSIVGARAATHYGQRIAAEMAATCVGCEYAVVSGGAFGIDAAAHRGALAAGGATVCVVAGGVDRVYPAAHEALFRSIHESGLLVSEVPLGFAPMRQRFLHRNRLIAALAPATVVVEAGLRSGSLSTARRAAELSRIVGAVPGPVTSAASAGCHELIRDRVAELVTGGEDLLGLVRGLLVDPCDGLRERAVHRPEDELSPLGKRLWDALPVQRPAGLEAVVRSSGCEPDEVRRGLGELLVSGMAVRENGSWRKA